MRNTARGNRTRCFRQRVVLPEVQRILRLADTTNDRTTVMARTETIAEGVTLHLGDCLEIIPQMPMADVIITDPPFSSGARTDAGKSVRGAMLRGDKWQDDWFSHDNLAT